MESFFATLKKERRYQINTSEMKLADVKTVVYRFVCYYNLRWIYTANGGYPPLVYREMYYANTAAQPAADLDRLKPVSGAAGAAVSRCFAPVTNKVIFVFTHFLTEPILTYPLRLFASGYK